MVNSIRQEFVDNEEINFQGYDGYFANASDTEEMDPYSAHLLSVSD
jgi:hypothetical protein